MVSLLLALTLGAGAVAQIEEPRPHGISLDVIVTDARGQRINTLTAADFTVVERGQRLKVDAARFVSNTGAARRLFAILLDDYHIAAGRDAERVREALTRFVLDDLRPDDTLVVLRPLDSLLEIALSTDRAAALGAIAAFAPRRGDFSPRSEFERNFIAEAPARAAATRARIVTAALNALTTHLGRFDEARKTLIVVSDGFVNDGIRRGELVVPPLRSVIASANRSNVAIYTVAPNVATTGDADSLRQTHEALRSLAAGTGGVSVEGPDDPRRALRTAVADASGFYVVTFMAAGEADGQLASVDVAVARPHLSVRTQRAYGRPPAPERRPPSVPSFLSAFSARTPRRTSVLIRPWFGLSPGDAGKTRVSFVWEPSPRTPGDRTRTMVPSSIDLSITTLDGQPVFAGTVRAAMAGLTPTDDSTRASFDAPAGRLLVQMSIRDISSKVMDRDVRDLVVGGFPGPVSLGTAEVLRARSVREQRANAANPHTTPVASRQFSRSERLLVRVPVVAAAPPVVSARLVSAFGGVMTNATATQVPGREGFYQFELPLASYATGAYSVQISATTVDGTATDSLSIRITP